MNLSISQWLLRMAVDVLIKAGCCYLLLDRLLSPPFSAYGLLVPLCVGMVWSSCHFCCLLVARTIADTFRPSRAISIVFTVVAANVLFIGIIYLGLAPRTPVRPTDIQYDGTIALFLVAANLIPIAIAAALDLIADRFRRPSPESAFRQQDHGVNDDSEHPGPFGLAPIKSLSRHWIGMSKGRRARIAFVALVMFPVVLPTAALFSYVALYVYSLNNICEPGDHQIHSEADAITVAKSKIIGASAFRMSNFGGVPDFVNSLGRAENCCSAVRSRRAGFVIVWEVRMTAPPDDKLHRSATLTLSNCGYVFPEASYLDSD